MDFGSMFGNITKQGQGFSLGGKGSAGGDIGGGFDTSKFSLNGGYGGNSMSGMMGGMGGGGGNVWEQVAKAVAAQTGYMGEAMQGWAENMRGGMNPEMENLWNAWAVNIAPSMMVEQYADYKASSQRSDQLWNQMQAGQLPAAIEKAIGTAKQWGQYGLEKVGPAATRTALQQQFKPALSEIDRMYAGRGVSGGQSLAAKQQLLDAMTQQGYGAQQQGSLMFSNLMAQMEPAMRSQAYYNQVNQFYNELGIEQMIRNMMFGGMQNAVETKPGPFDVLGSVMASFKAGQEGFSS